MVESNLSIRLFKERFKFSCAHFVVHAQERERLHGHNYQVGVVIEGKMNDDGYIVDFGIVKKLTLALCKEWNERFIYPTKNKNLHRVEETFDGNITFKTNDGAMFSFPMSDCALVPINDTSVENLAREFHRLLCEKLAENCDTDNMDILHVTVSETDNQSATYASAISTND